VSLHEANLLAGLDEDELLRLALIGHIEARMRWGREYLQKDSLMRYLALRESMPTGFVALRIPENGDGRRG
jgi:hypothetical protein